MSNLVDNYLCQYKITLRQLKNKCDEIVGDKSMHDALFRQQLDILKAEGNYRVFADLKRHNGFFPRAKNFGSENLDDAFDESII